MFLSEAQDDFGPLPVAERCLIDNLLQSSFKGALELREQSEWMLGKRVDSNGSFRLAVTVAKPAEVARRIPVEGTYLDSDGVRVHILLHVVDGYLDELELYREDSAPVVRTVATSPEIEIGDMF